MPLVKLGLNKGQKGQNPHKITPLIVFHQTQASRRFLATLTKFDPKLTLGGPKNPNFDLVVGTGWNQDHCKDYQVFIPRTIHGLKSELELPRYHENWVNVLINAPLTSWSHNFWSYCWIFKFHTFLETKNPDISKGVKINLIRGLWGEQPLKVFRLKKCAKAINSTRHPLD